MKRWIVMRKIYGGQFEDDFTVVGRVEADNPEKALRKALDVESERELAEVVKDDSQPVGAEFVVEPVDREHYIRIAEWNTEDGKLKIEK